MRVVLIRAKTEKIANTERPLSMMRAEGTVPPLGIAYVAAFLEENGHIVSIEDGAATGTTSSEMASKIKEIKPDIAGVTCTTPEIREVIELCNQIKREDKNIFTVVGGPQLSCFQKETVRFDCVDFGIKGEGEHTFAELAGALEKRIADFSRIRGLVWKKNRRVLVNPQRKPLENLDALPFPARHLLPLHRYHSFLMGTPMTTIIAARGCPYSCAYCFRDDMTSGYRCRDPIKVVDELEECINRFGIREFAFLDDCWPKKHMLNSLCDEVLDRGLDLRWNIRQRVDLVDPALLSKMKKAGCTFIKYGVESGSERILKMMNKGVGIRTIKEAFASARKEGITTFGYFMVGYATETKEEFEATLELAKKLSPDWAMFNATIPFPNTKLLEFATKKCGFDGKYWQNWVKGKSQKKMEPLLQEAEKRCVRAYKEFYFRPGYAIQKLKNIRSLQELIRYGRGAFAVACAKPR